MQGVSGRFRFASKINGVLLTGSRHTVLTFNFFSYLYKVDGNLINMGLG